MTRHHGFTLIELMIVIAIIGLLAAIAIPAYQDYIARAQVTEAVELLASSKMPLAEFYSDKGRWPAEAASVIGTLTGKYVQSVEITQGNGSTDSTVLEITATMKMSGVSALVQGGTLMISTETAGRIWNCYQGTISPRYRPSACK
jgi:type IV pilus assembly protein PilA